MKKGKLNVTLFAGLFDICGCPMKETLRDAGISYNSFHDWILTERGEIAGRTRYSGGIPVEDLVKTCNALCVPVSRLFYPEGKSVVLFPSRNELVVASSRFRPVQFDFRAFQNAFGKRSQAGMSQDRMFERLGVSEFAYRRWIREGKSTLRVARLEQFCDTFDYDILDFFKDDNAPLKKPREKAPVDKTASLEEENARLKADYDSLIGENARLFRENKELRELVARLKDEVTQLKVQKSEQAYEIVRLKQHIESMENGFTGMVAED